jgi:hypothetical protein
MLPSHIVLQSGVTPRVVQLVLTLQVESSLQFQIQALLESGVRNKTLKKDDQNAYPEVAPHCPLSSSICRIRRKTVIGPTGGKRMGAITPSDLAEVVQMHEVT